MRTFLLFCTVFFFLGCVHAQAPYAIAIPVEQINKEINHVELAQTFEQMGYELSDPIFFFTAACHWTLYGDNESAFYCLYKSISLGFDKVEWLSQEPDLASLKTTLAWWDVMRRAEANLNINAKENLSISTEE